MRHADDAEQVAAARGLGVGQAAQAEDEEDGGADVGDGGQAGGHVRVLVVVLHLRNIASMRRVTAKPPNMLTAVSTSAKTARPEDQPRRPVGPAAPVSGGATCTSAPMAMIDEMALVTLISGVCSDGVTFHTTM
jgi:hypothetical protein